METIVSLCPSDKVGDLCLQIHGHFENEHDCIVALDNVVQSYMKTVNPKQKSIISTKPKWESFENGTLFGIPDGLCIVVWQKYSKPGRVYGESARRRIVRVFERVPYDGGVTRHTTVAMKSAPPADVKRVSFGNVIEELKDRFDSRVALLSKPRPRVYEKEVHPIKMIPNPLFVPTTEQDDDDVEIEDMVTQIMSRIRRDVVMSDNSFSENSISDHSGEEDTLTDSTCVMSVSESFDSELPDLVSMSDSSQDASVSWPLMNTAIPLLDQEDEWISTYRDVVNEWKKQLADRTQFPSWEPAWPPTEGFNW